MNIEYINHREVHTLDELLEGLETLKADAHGNPVFLENPKIVTLVERTLSGGSVVYDIRVEETK